jgi:hypothetical protein
MSSTATVQEAVTQGPKSVRVRQKTPARYFFVIAAVTMLTVADLP